jgi:hypothetical protein
VIVCLVMACVARHEETLPRPQHVPLRVVPDVTSANLPPEQELDALLQGVEGLGKTVDVVRLAVPPFETLGLPSANAWMGEAAADVFMTGLTRMPGVTVLERGVMSTLIAERKKNADDPEVAKQGKVLGAQMIVLGRLINDSGHLALAVRPVRVATGASAKGFTLPLDAHHMRESMDAAVASFGADLGLTPASGTAGPGLAPDDLELAAKARTLQYEGKLVEAQPLYARALAKPSTAWRFEADYLQLMADLGMYDWTEARAKDLLLRIPVGLDTMCDRTRIFLQHNRAKLRVDDTREAVRMAATCGEPELIARSLFFLAFSMEKVDFAMARAANQRALKILGDHNPWTRCAIEWQAADYDATLGGDWHGSREKLFSSIGERCAAAGNNLYASAALDTAADTAWSPERRHELYMRSLELAKQGGGQQLDETAARAAAELRRSGQPSQADDLILERIGDHLRALDAIYGALPDDAEALDDDLVRRAGLQRHRGVSRTDLSEAEQLLATVHKKALATALDAWAQRTRLESTRQADDYAGIARRLAPPSVQASPDDQIAAAGSPALRGSGTDVRAALGALYTSHASPDLIEKLATWYGAPAFIREAMRLTAEARLAKGDPDGALDQLRVTERYAKDDPSWELVVNEMTRRAWDGRDAAKALAVREQRVDIAKRVSTIAWIEALVGLGVAEVHAGGATKQIAALAQASKDLAAQHAWEPAAYALQRASWLSNEAHAATGSDEVVAMYRERVALLDRLGDPLRSLEARADLLEQIDLAYFQAFRSAKPQLAADRDVIALVQQIDDGCDKLVQAGRQRDAARVVVRLIAVAPGVDKLLAKALGWSAAFKDSSEYPVLVGKLHDQLSRVSDDHTTIVAEAAMARDALWAAAPDDALWEYSRLIAYVDGEPAMWGAYDQCAADARVPARMRGCVWGLYYWLVRAGVLADKTHAHTALVAARDLSTALDRALVTRDRIELREAIAMLSLYSDDRTGFDAALGEIETAYAKNPYELATSLHHLWSVTRHRDPKLALSLAGKLVASNGASPAWRAKLYADFAATARDAGDKPAESKFLADGSALATGDAAAWRGIYAEYPARAAVKAKDWKRVQAVLADVRKSVDEPHWQGELDLALAVTRAYQHDVAGALASLASRVTTAESDTASPCLDVETLETAASLELATGHCERGTALRTKATEARARCTQRACLPGERVRCDDPATAAAWKGTNACHAAFAGSFPIVAE